MRPSRPWHFTRFGRLAFWLGGLELAVPVMILVAGALAWGTYLDSAYGAKLAKTRVYGSWWFLGLMALICVSLTFAVVTRYPWKRRHVGFITVHAGLITLIAGGFWSLFGRVEGRLMLQEGTAAADIETDVERLEVLEVRAGELIPVTSVAADSGAGRLDLEGLSLFIEERWTNTREDTYVADDGPEPLRAVEVAFGEPAAEGTWVGEESRGGAATLHGVQVRVLSPGAAWEPPTAPPAAEPGYAFVLGEQRFPLAGEGQEAVPGWTIVSIRRFESALVSTGGLTENTAGTPNPATEVTISDGKGTTERHTAFLSFPDMVMAKTMEGTARSGAAFRAAPAGGGESLVILHADPPALRVAYVSAAGVQQQEFSGPPPWTFDAGRHRVTILRQFTRARVASRFVPAPPASERRPALVVRAGEGARLVVPWKGTTPLPGFSAMLRYGPQTVPLPFSVRLDDFRKLDYPGTEMAMAYESDVTMTASGREPRSQRIYMNNPLAHAGWKVYQSGFVGENISIFSVMKDPGIPVTYAGCIAVVVGIIITFYSRAYSWGHPGIAVPFAQRSEPMLRCILLICLVLTTAATPARASEPWMDRLAAIPIQDGGRVMPLDTYARHMAAQLTGRSRWSAEKGPAGYAGRLPIQLLCDLLFRADDMSRTPLVAVENRPFKIRVGLDSAQKFFTAAELSNNQAISELIAQFGQARAVNDSVQPTPDQRRALDISRAVNRIAGFASGQPLAIIPAGPQQAYRKAGPLGGDPGTETVRTVLHAMGVAYRSGTAGAMEAATDDLQRTIDSAAPTDQAVARAVRLELFYNRHGPWRMTAVAYVASIIVFGLSRLAIRRPLTILAVGLGLWGVAEHLLGLGLRTAILGRVPVSNTYEALLWMGLVGIGVALVAQLIARGGWYLFAGLVASLISVLFAGLVPLTDQTNALPAVLRSNFWLTIHVLTIVASYGVLAVAAVLGHVYLIRHVLLAPRADADADGAPAPPLIVQTYRTIQVGLILLTAGTILGGVWAADSWGRFWGWDPKETWALISILVYLAVLHARHVRWIRDFGLAAAAVLGFVSIVWCFYGVNYVMATGLHSYGFGSGGETWVALWVAIEILFVTVCRVRLVRMIRAAPPAEPAPPRAAPDAAPA